MAAKSEACGWPLLLQLLQSMQKQQSQQNEQAKQQFLAACHNGWCSNASVRMSSEQDTPLDLRTCKCGSLYLQTNNNGSSPRTYQSSSGHASETHGTSIDASRTSDSAKDEADELLAGNFALNRAYW